MKKVVKNKKKQDLLKEEHEMISVENISKCILTLFCKQLIKYDSPPIKYESQYTLHEERNIVLLKGKWNACH